MLHWFVCLPFLPLSGSSSQQHCLLCPRLLLSACAQELPLEGRPSSGCRAQWFGLMNYLLHLGITVQKPSRSLFWVAAAIASANFGRLCHPGGECTPDPIGERGVFLSASMGMVLLLQALEGRGSRQLTASIGAADWHQDLQGWHHIWSGSASTIQPKSLDFKLHGQDSGPSCAGAWGLYGRANGQQQPWVETPTLLQDSPWQGAFLQSSTSRRATCHGFLHNWGLPTAAHRSLVHSANAQTMGVGRTSCPGRIAIILHHGCPVAEQMRTSLSRHSPLSTQGLGKGQSFKFF